jgi:hypothetical protein
MHSFRGTHVLVPSFSRGSSSARRPVGEDLFLCAVSNAPSSSVIPSSEFCVCLGKIGKLWSKGHIGDAYDSTSSQV